MATMTLLPDGTGLSAAAWSANGEATRHECLDDDNGDTSYCHCAVDSRSMTLTYADPSVTEANIASIESVQFTSSGRCPLRSGTGDVDISFLAPTPGFSETAAYDASPGTYETITGTVRTTHDGTHPWSYANLEALQMLCTKNGTVDVYLSYLALIVSYTPAVVDSATFFGTNF